MHKMAAVFARKCCSQLFSAKIISFSQVRIKFISISGSVAGGQRWRISQGLASDGLAYGPLTDLPDWSFVDGQSAPESKRRKKRQNKRLKESERITQYLKDLESSDSKILE